MTSTLNEMPCSVLKGVGPRLEVTLQKLGIHHVQDLLFHLPRTYQDRTRLVPLNKIRPGQTIAVEGRLIGANIVFRGRRQMICQIQDGSGYLTIRFFHFSQAQFHALKPGVRFRCFGEVRFGQQGYEMVHPEYRCLKDDAILENETFLTPVYSSTEGISQFTWRKLMTQALNLLTKHNGLEELLPDDILTQLQFPQLIDALHYLHRPPANADIDALNEGKHPYQQRLIFEELLAHHLSLRRIRERAKKQSATALPARQLISKFLKQLPFQLTGAQTRVYQEIVADLSKEQPMLRLVQGDVGSGKTVIAVLAALHAVENHHQAAIMAPTELLAEQHLQNVAHWLTPLGIKIAWLSGQLKGKARAETLSHIQSGEAQIIIGTHALFQNDVEFKNLALIVIDEQHRFGVHQRLALREKGKHLDYFPHQLIMTATPIPRTLAMSAYADLDHSIIDELPPGRKPITTTVIGNHRRASIIDRIRTACQEGRQVYWVCTLIEESEVLQCQAAENTAEELKTSLNNLNIGLVHGRMKSREKEIVMAGFKNKKYDVLVATTVIEVGVDVPNASLMIIENAERLGLAQLHQLRGRIGRGSIASYCVLLYQTPLSQNAKKRLNIMRDSQDGFIIAQKDLEIRGPGEVLGSKQAGIINMRVADIIRDKKWLPEVKNTAALLFCQHSDNIGSLIHRWIANAERYGNA